MIFQNKKKIKIPNTTNSIKKIILKMSLKNIGNITRYGNLCTDKIRIITTTKKNSI